MSRVNDFAFKSATINGTGSASANSLLMQAIFRMGIPVTGKNIFPSPSLRGDSLPSAQVAGTTEAVRIRRAKVTAPGDC